MNDKSDAQLVAAWRQTVESCRAHYVGDWQQTSLHIPARDMLQLVEMAEKWLAVCTRFNLVAVSEDTVRITINDDPLPIYGKWPLGTDPDTGQLTCGDYMGDANGD